MPVYLEDHVVGEVRRFGSYPVTREEVIQFASAYDPQPFHLSDTGGAANPIFGRLAASGWHTAAMGMRMVVDEGQRSGEGMSLGSPGLEELTWLRPVYPGDTLSCENEVLDARPLKSRRGIGVVKFRLTIRNQHDEAVMRQVGSHFVLCRPDGEDED